MLIYPLVLAFFTDVIACNEQVLQSVAETSYEMQVLDGKLVFTIDALYKHLMPAGELSYKQFRSALYASTLNCDLQSLGYQISIYANAAKVDESTYQLSKL